MPNKMKPITLSTAWATALLIFATALTANAAPLLNGLALEQQFNKDLYIAAVYSERLSDSASALLDNGTPRKLEVRIVADRLSARRFRNQWMEGIAINNPGDTLSAQAEDMVTFANLFQGYFLAGDQLTVEYAADGGTTSVALNDIDLGQIGNREFFNTLLRAWIGPIPPSTDFRGGLLAAGQVSSTLLGSFESLQPSSERVAEVAELATQQSESKTETAAASPAETAAKPQATPPIPAPTLASLDSKVEEPLVAAPPRPQLNAQGEPAQAQTAAAKPQPAASRRPAVPEMEEEEDEAPLTADLILARQIYHSMLLRHTFKHIRYPKRAQERGQEGSVRLNVTIDPKGNIKDIQTLQESRYASLNREAQDAINRAGPYPAAPGQLARDNYQFSVPITFRLPD
jgi:TonB family protein